MKSLTWLPNLCYQQQGKGFGLSMVECQSSRLGDIAWCVNEEKQKTKWALNKNF